MTGIYLHMPVCPLYFLGNIEARMQNQLVQMAQLVIEARLAVTALLRCAELVLEEGVVLSADNGEVVAHDGGAGRGACAEMGGCVGSMRM